MARFGQFITGGRGLQPWKGLASAQQLWRAVAQARASQCGCAKLDPYLNVDPGNDEPGLKHGEVFVTR